MSTYAEVRDATLKDHATQYLEAEFIRRADNMDILDVMLIIDHLRGLFGRKYTETTGRDWRR